MTVNVGSKLAIRKGQSRRGLIRRTLRGLARRTLREIQLQPRRFNISSRRLPDFLIIGAQKSGSTSLYNYLVRHPHVLPSLAKEIHFFDNNYGRGTEWYRAHFAAETKGRDFQVGEATPYYLFHPLCPARIAAVVPDAKLLVILRNPIDRAYSHYQHELRRHHEWLSFEEAIERESERLAGETERMLRNESFYSVAHQRHSYLARGRYSEQLQGWFQLFPRDQFLIRDIEAFRTEPGKIYSEVLDFLDLPQHKLDAFRMYYSWKYEKMSPETRERLIEYFREPNRQLFETLGTCYDWDR